MKNANDIARIRSVLQADKSVMSEACEALVLRDFAEKFNEYFHLNGLPKMQISCVNGKYKVDIQFEAENIKKFNVLK